MGKIRKRKSWKNFDNENDKDDFNDTHSPSTSTQSVRKTNESKGKEQQEPTEGQDMQEYGADKIRMGSDDEIDLPKKKRKLHTYEKARLSYDKIKAERQHKFEEKQRRNIERQEALAAYQKDKKDKMKKMYKKTKRGQPKLSTQVEYLLGKLERTIQKEKEDA